MTFICPCCKQTLDAPRAPLDGLTSAPLAPQQRKIVAALARVYPRFLGKEAVIDAVYGDDPDGGPETVETIIKARISQTRSVIGKFGWTISNAQSGRGSHGRYRLEPLEG